MFQCFAHVPRVITEKRVINLRDPFRERGDQKRPIGVAFGGWTLHRRIDFSCGLNFYH